MDKTEALTIEDLVPKYCTFETSTGDSLSLIGTLSREDHTVDVMVPPVERAVSGRHGIVKLYQIAFADALVRLNRQIKA